MPPPVTKLIVSSEGKLIDVFVSSVWTIFSASEIIPANVEIPDTFKLLTLNWFVSIPTVVIPADNGVILIGDVTVSYTHLRPHET